MKWLVTGVEGFLGSAVAEAASAAGYEVVGLGRAAAPQQGWKGVYVRSDLAAPEATAEILRATQPDVVAHFAGTASVGDSFAAPMADFESSTLLWFRVLEAVRLSGLKPRVALASSAAVYGSPECLPVAETAARNPESPYGFHKVLSEQAGEEFAKCFGLSVVSLRFFSVFGPRQRRLLVWELFDQLRRGGRVLRLKGTGAECRDFLPSWEAAAAVLAACASAGEGFQPVNIASGTGVTTREVAGTLADCAGGNVDIVFAGESLRGNPDRWEADVTRLRTLAPRWQPEPFAKSLALCVEAWNADASRADGGIG